MERDLICTRTAEGRERAKARGQHTGRPPKLTPQQQKEARGRRAEGATLKELAKSYNVARATIFPAGPMSDGGSTIGTVATFRRIALLATSRFG